MYGKRRLKSPPRSSPSPQSSYCFFPSISTKKRQIGAIFHTTLLTHQPSKGPLTSKQIEKPSGHNPRHPETTKESTPQSRSRIAMKKEVVHKLLSLLTHVTFVYHNNKLLPKIIQSKDLAKSRSPHKKGTIEGA